MLDGVDTTTLRRVTDALCDRGTLTRLLLHRTGRETRVYAVDADAALAADAAMSPRVVALTATGSRVPLDDAACDGVFSLLTFGFAAWLPLELRRILRPGGTLRVLTWDPQAPPPHEAILGTALHEATGESSQFIDAVLAAPSPGTELERIRDVVRFDGFAHYWAALVDERPIARAVHRLPAQAQRVLQARCRDALSTYAAADGTVRIPVTALLQQAN